MAARFSSIPSILLVNSAVLLDRDSAMILVLSIKLDARRPIFWISRQVLMKARLRWCTESEIAASKMTGSSLKVAKVSGRSERRG
jgi:hypothetical protein